MSAPSLWEKRRTAVEGRQYTQYVRIAQPLCFDFCIVLFCLQAREFAVACDTTAVVFGRLRFYESPMTLAFAEKYGQGSNFEPWESRIVYRAQHRVSYLWYVPSIPCCIPGNALLWCWSKSTTSFAHALSGMQRSGAMESSTFRNPNFPSSIHASASFRFFFFWHGGFMQVLVNTVICVVVHTAGQVAPLGVLRLRLERSLSLSW